MKLGKGLVGFGNRNTGFCAPAMRIVVLARRPRGPPTTAKAATWRQGATVCSTGLAPVATWHGQHPRKPRPGIRGHPSPTRRATQPRPPVPAPCHRATYPAALLPAACGYTPAGLAAIGQPALVRRCRYISTQHGQRRCPRRQCASGACTGTRGHGPSPWPMVRRVHSMHYIAELYRCSNRHRYYAVACPHGRVVFVAGTAWECTARARYLNQR